MFSNNFYLFFSCWFYSLSLSLLFFWVEDVYFTLTSGNFLFFFFLLISEQNLMSYIVRGCPWVWKVFFL